MLINNNLNNNIKFLDLSALFTEMEFETVGISIPDLKKNNSQCL